jgi:hypothetical protein
VKRLEAIFKRKLVSHEDDNGDDNSFSEYREFIDPSDVEYWSIELDPMTGWTQFLHKFKIALVALPILYNEHVKDVLFEKGGTLLIHCKITGDEPRMFTVCVELKNSHSTFQFL